MNRRSTKILLMLILSAIMINQTMTAYAGWQKEEKWRYYNAEGNEKMGNGIILMRKGTQRMAGRQ